LRGDVESPGGATIAGSLALEAGGFQSSIYSAVAASTNKARQLGALKTK
jgi:pyrroline-5-carboxylate reductase